MIGTDSYRNIKRITIAWIIISLTRAAHGMSEIWFIRKSLKNLHIKDFKIKLQSVVLLNDSEINVF